MILSNFSLVLSIAGHPRDFLLQVPELQAIGGENINPGNDDGEDDDDEVFADRQEEQKEEEEADPEREPSDLAEEDLEAVIDEIARIAIDDEDMKIINKRTQHQPVQGAPITVPTAIHAVVTVLQPGTQLSTLTANLSNNQKDGEVHALLAPEINLASNLIPHRKMIRENPSIGTALPLAIQEVLNKEETDKDPFSPRPLSKGRFRLTHRGAFSGKDGPLDPTQLGLKPENPGDKFILHRVQISNTNGAVPCFVVTLFFLEERTEKTLHSPQFERKLPGYDNSPRSSPPRADGTNSNKHKRHRGGVFGAFANLFTWS